MAATDRLQQFTDRNVKSRRQLEELGGGLSTTQLGLPIPDAKWTIAVEFAHLAFWDRRVIYELEQWAQTHTEPSHIDADSTNFAALSQWQTLPARDAVRLAIEAAREVDEQIATTPNWLVDAILESGRTHFLSRAEHRLGHLAQIELALRNCGC